MGDGSPRGAQPSAFCGRASHSESSRGIPELSTWGGGTLEHFHIVLNCDVHWVWKRRWGGQQTGRWTSSGIASWLVQGSLKICTCDGPGAVRYAKGSGRDKLASGKDRRMDGLGILFEKQSFSH